MTDEKAAQLLTLLAAYSNEYALGQLDTMTVRELAGDLIDTVPDELLPKRPALEVFGFDYTWGPA